MYLVLPLLQQFQLSTLILVLQNKRCLYTLFSPIYAGINDTINLSQKSSLKYILRRGNNTAIKAYPNTIAPSQANLIPINYIIRLYFFYNFYAAGYVIVVKHAIKSMLRSKMHDNTNVVIASIFFKMF